MKATFREDLADGRGRAWLRVKRSGGRGLAREVDRACLRDFSFDAQVEGIRGDWLYEIAALAGRLEELRPRVLRSLRMRKTQRDDYGDHWTLIQRLEFAAEDAARGCTEAREVVLAFAERHRRRFSGHSDPAVLRAAGEAGFEAALRWMARDAAHPGRWNGLDEFSSLLRAASEVLGPRAATRVLQRVCAESPTVERVRKATLARPRSAQTTPESLARRALYGTLRRVRTKSLSVERARRAILALPRSVLKDRPLSWSETRLQAVLAGKRWASDPELREWGVTASARALASIERRLTTERDPEVLRRLLVILELRKPRAAADRVLALAARGKLAVRRAALDALDPKTDRRGRDLAIRIVERGPSSLLFSAIDLLARCPREGDAAIVLRRLGERFDRNTTHGVGHSLLDWIKLRRPSRARGLLLWVWDRSPCSSCRDDALRGLIRERGVPARVLREAAHDASRDVRARARSARRRGRRVPSV